MSQYLNKYKTKSELIKFIAYSPISFERYERLNNYFSRKNRFLQARDYPVLPGQNVFASLVFDTGETYIDYLERVNIIQFDSKLLSFPFELESSIRDLLDLNQIDKNDLTMPNRKEYPLIISGDLQKIISNEDLFVIKDQAGAYFPILNIIIIDQIKITAVSNNFTWDDGYSVWPNYNSTYEIVLRHEIGHWLFHELLVNGMYFIDSEFMNLNPEIHEFWAQILGFNLLRFNQDFQSFMNLLAKNQTEIYQYYLRFSDELSHQDLRNMLIKRDKITNTSELIRFISEIKKNQ